VSVIAQVGLCASRAAAAPPAKPAELPILFDAQDAWVRPLVRITTFGRKRNVLLDTGSDLHVFRPKSAGVSADVVEAKGSVSDVGLRDRARRTIGGAGCPVA
jgi:hypothetical protein